MSGTDNWQPKLAASSFAMFLRVLAVTNEVAAGFSEENLDYDDEFDLDLDGEEVDHHLDAEGAFDHDDHHHFYYDDGDDSRKVASI